MIELIKPDLYFFFAPMVLWLWYLKSISHFLLPSAQLSLCIPQLLAQWKKIMEYGRLWVAGVLLSYLKCQTPQTTSELKLQPCCQYGCQFASLSLEQAYDFIFVFLFSPNLKECNSFSAILLNWFEIGYLWNLKFSAGRDERDGQEPDSLFL